MVIESNQEIISQIKDLLHGEKISQKELAGKLGITPQALNDLMQKKNFSFNDANRILSAVGYLLIVDIKKPSMWDILGKTKQHSRL